MRAMVLEAPGQPLRMTDVSVKAPGRGQVLLRVEACGVCRTDLHILDGELKNPKLPLILGHEIVGRVVSSGEGAVRFDTGRRVGVPWLGYTDQCCRYCRRNQENLCDNPLFTGYTLDGGYAEFILAYENYCFSIPERYDSVEAAPLLCAGLIGYRSYRMTGPHVENLGIYGFGAAAHIIAQIAIHDGKDVFAFTRPGDTVAQKFARKLGAVWAGDSTDKPPDKLDAALIFAPIGSLIPAALAATRKGATVVCGGIHMSDIPSFPYTILWEERVIRSVANLTRRDGDELFDAAARVAVRTETRPYPLEKANEALGDLREGRLSGAAVLVPQ
ncbi:MAG: zinc-binding alcohol dehydrogenase family protein [Chitinivibrionales bacterium]|nr:zinc-binding alcohol dehydrogenase family protein [Chitinivibrionales bacterium]MBD3357637.1 zinc-binding alcohol dehydrogenase family protein [Chitinivibrionales bacterium]